MRARKAVAVLLLFLLGLGLAWFTCEKETKRSCWYTIEDKGVRTRTCEAWEVCKVTPLSGLILAILWGAAIIILFLYD